MNAFRSGIRSELARIASSRFEILYLTLFPLILLGAMAAMIWGGALRDLPVVVVDQDGGPIARKLIRNLAATPALRLTAEVADPLEALAMVRSERAVAYVVIPEGVGSRRPGAPPVEVFYEAVFLSTGSLASTYLQVVAEATLVEELPTELGVAGAPYVDRKSVV